MASSAETRRSELQDVLARERYIKVADLSQRFSVSQMSIRRDVRQLEEQGLLRRVHGGMVATPLSRLGLEISSEFVSQIQEQNLVKEKIARAAAHLVQPGDHLIFDCGNIAYLVACALSGDLLTQGDLTVITNSMPVALELAPWPGVEIILLGGEYQAGGMMNLIGPNTLRSLEGLHADKMFLTVEAIDILQGVTTAGDSFESALAKRMIAACTCVILLVTGSRIGRAERYQILPLSGAQILVTDGTCPGYFASQLRDRGIEVIHLPRDKGQEAC